MRADGAMRNNFGNLISRIPEYAEMRRALKELFKFCGSDKAAFIFTAHVHQSVINDRREATSQQRQPVAMLTVSAINRAQRVERTSDDR